MKAEQQQAHDEACAQLHDWGISHGDCPYPAPSAAESKGRFDVKIAEWGFLNFTTLADLRTSGLYARAVDNAQPSTRKRKGARNERTNERTTAVESGGGSAAPGVPG